MATTPIMPGSFMPDHDNARYCPTAKPLFIPPSPSASSVLSQSIRLQSKDARKRPRADSRSRSSTPRVSRTTLLSTSTHSLDAPSPAPLVSTEYVFAGGTPSASRYHEDYSQYDYEQDLRHNRYSHTSTYDHEDTTVPRTPQSEHGSKRRRLASQETGWGRTMWNLTGGIAGKAINFCWTVAFNGFHASSGKGYDMDFDTPVVVSENPADISRSRDVFDTAYRDERRTPIPGGFPEDRLDRTQARQRSWESIPTPTTSNGWEGGTSLKSNWVMVDAPAMRDAETSPARKRSRPSTANLYARPTVKAPNTRPRLVPRHSASYASPRASLGARTSLAPATNSGDDRPDTAGSDRPRHQRTRSSIASPRRSEGNSATPVSPDVVKFEKRMQKHTQKQDVSMQRLSRQMQDMIREAQQALGSKVEITDGDDEDFDEGYHEGTLHAAGSWQ